MGKIDFRTAGRKANRTHEILKGKVTGAGWGS